MKPVTYYAREFVTFVLGVILTFMFLLAFWTFLGWMLGY